MRKRLQNACRCKMNEYKNRAVILIELTTNREDY